MKESLFFKNSYYQGLVQNLYGGAKGCFSLFMHFFYQYGQSLVFDKKISVCMFKLYMLELQNCEILAEILIKMGGDNKFYSHNRKFLSGYSVDYIKDFAQIYYLDVELLEIGIINVKSAYEKIEDEAVREGLKKVLSNKKIELDLLKENFLKNLKQ